MSEFIKTGLFGHPVAHSKSPLIHNYWIKKFGLTGEYTAMDVRPDNLENKIKECMKAGYTGLNLTLPHKEAVMSLCDSVDEIARSVGAVNTLVIYKGKISGFNTDVFGFVENIQESEPSFVFFAGPAVVLGAGGAAHAVVYALQEQGAPDIRILNRTKERAEELARHFKNARAVSWDERSESLAGANILINTTSLGLEGQPPLEIDLSCLDPKTLVHDIIYSPLYTPLLRQAEAHGCHVVNGIGMLVHQARPAFRKWFGVLPDYDIDLMQRVRE